MEHETAPKRLDIKALALAGQTLSGSDLLLNYERLKQELRGLEPESSTQMAVQWSARGEFRSGSSGAGEPWLHLSVSARLPLVCQRCMGPVDVHVELAQRYRFVATEAIAEAEDDEAEEDLLVISREFDLAGLIEDELLMAVPIVPRHDTCPVAVPMQVADEAFDDAAGERPNPFAGLKGLVQTRKPG
ncbi:MAG: YceD family protein [Rhodoferax sp.]